MVPLVKAGNIDWSDVMSYKILYETPDAELFDYIASYLTQPDRIIYCTL